MGTIHLFYTEYCSMILQDVFPAVLNCSECLVEKKSQCCHFLKHFHCTLNLLHLTLFLHVMGHLWQLSDMTSLFCTLEAEK